MPARMNPQRFKILAGWDMGEEFHHATRLKSAWSTDDEHVLAGIYFIETERAFCYVLFVRDKGLRYGVFFLTTAAFPTSRGAEISLLSDFRIIESGEKPAPEREEAEGGVALFEAKVERPSDKFLNLRDSRHAKASREVMTEIARWFDDMDGNYVKDLQSTGFRPYVSNSKIVGIAK